MFILPPSSPVAWYAACQSKPGARKGEGMSCPAWEETRPQRPQDQSLGAKIMPSQQMNLNLS